MDWQGIGLARHGIVYLYQKIMSIKMITPVLLKTYIALKEASSWLTVNDITEISENKPNTVSRQVRKLSKEKVLEVFEMHSGNYYRLSQDASDISVVQRLEASLTIIKI